MFVKKIVTISLFIFGAAVAAVLTGGLVFNDDPPAQAPKNTETCLNTTASEGITLTIQEVAKHNAATDCWLVIEKKVYNASSYINIHPGGPGKIIPFCGKEATAAFETKGGEGTHSQAARNLLAQFYVGDLNQQLNSKILQDNLLKIQRATEFKNGSFDQETENEAGDD